MQVFCTGVRLSEVASSVSCMDLSGERPPFEWDDDAPLKVSSPRLGSGLPAPRAAEPDDPRDDQHDDAAPPAEVLHQALLDDPLTDGADQRRLLRSVVADLTTGLPCADQLAGLDALLTLTSPEDGLGLSEREWIEVTCAIDRCTSHLDAMRLTAVAALDQRVLTTAPAGRLRRDSRRPAADALAPALKIAPGSASALVGLARRSLDMPLACDALADGQMTSAQFRVLDTVLRRIPDLTARAEVEAIAVRKAATTVRAQLAAILEEAAVQADPGYVARTTALGVADRDARLVRSPVPGCQRVLIDLERSDAARFWQVLNQAATLAKDTPTLDEATGAITEEERTLPQLRADWLVSLVVGMFSPTAVQAAAQQDAADEGATDAEDEAGDQDGAGDDDDEDEDERRDPDLPPDTRALVRIPTPADRARLSELHVVVLADDLADLDDDGPGDGGGDDGDDDGPGEDGPRHGGTDGGATRQPGPRPPRPRRALAGHRPMGWLPGYGRLDPDTTAAIIDRAAWRRMVADPATGVLVQRSSWIIGPSSPPTTCQAPGDLADTPRTPAAAAAAAARPARPAPTAPRGVLPPQLRTGGVHPRPRRHLHRSRLPPRGPLRRDAARPHHRVGS